MANKVDCRAYQPRHKIVRATAEKGTEPSRIIFHDDCSSTDGWTLFQTNPERFAAVNGHFDIVLPPNPSEMHISSASVYKPIGITVAGNIELKLTFVEGDASCPYVQLIEFYLIDNLEEVKDEFGRENISFTSLKRIAVGRAGKFDENDNPIGKQTIISTTFAGNYYHDNDCPKSLRVINKNGLLKLLIDETILYEGSLIITPFSHVFIALSYVDVVNKAYYIDDILITD